MASGKSLNDKQNEVARGWAEALVAMHDGNQTKAAKSIGVNPSTLSSLLGGKDRVGLPRQGTSVTTALKIAAAVGVSKQEALAELGITGDDDEAEAFDLVGGINRAVAERSLRQHGFSFVDVRAAGDQVATRLKPGEDPDALDWWSDFIRSELRQMGAARKSPSLPPSPSESPTKELTLPETWKDWDTAIASLFRTMKEDERDTLGVGAVGFGKTPTDIGRPQQFDGSKLRELAKRFADERPAGKRPKEWMNAWRREAQKIYHDEHVQRAMGPSKRSPTRSK